MLTRRTFLTSATAAGLLPLLPASAQQAQADDFTRYVNIRIGTGGHGHTFPGATMPFGAVQLSPDTYTTGWDWCSGYYDADRSLQGFSHTHLSGTGAGDMLDVLLIPNAGPVKWDSGSRENPSAGYRAPFNHAEEKMEPGYYSVPLKDRAVLAELTCTTRVGLHRYTFQKGGDAHFVLDMAHSYGDAGVDRRTKQPRIPVKQAALTVVDDHTITGSRQVEDWAGGRVIFFAMQFSKPFRSVDLRQDGTVLPAGTKQASGTGVKAALHYTPGANDQVLVRCGISGVSVENAMKNIEGECPGYEFDKTRTAAKQAWNTELSRIRLETADSEQRTILYSALYHMLVAPTTYSDANGEYMGMDGKTYTLKAGEENYTAYSLWDTFRGLHPAYTLFVKDRVPGMVNNLTRMAERSPAGMPVWPLQGKETGTMTGYHSASVMAEAVRKKLPGIDTEAAYAVMRKRNMDDNWEGLGYYRDLGYIPADKEGESVSKCIEYCYNDWAVSHVADALGRHDDAAIQRKRSQNYQHLFDPKTQFIRAKLSDGKFTDPFDPIDMGHTPKWRDYTESNAWQTTFGIQHDVKGYMALWGGREPFVAKLDQLFTVPSTLPADAPPDIAGLVGQYAHGNEPSHHIAYLYVYAGQPWKTQARVASLRKTMYRNDPNGLEGNEDCGQMSAWYLLSALGLYAVDPVSGNYVLTSPLFEKATVNVGDGKELVIEAKRPSPDAVYIESVSLNGKQLDRLWVSHEEIGHGGRLSFVLSAEPNMTLGTAVEAAPPSLTA